MSEELNAVEEFMTEVLLDLMTKRPMSERGLSVGVHGSSKRTVQAYPSTSREAGPSRPSYEK
jgi:hypothetical protein